MTGNKDRRKHFKKCCYRECGNNLRDAIPGITFHVFPIHDVDRCIAWMVNSGNDDFAELSDRELRKRYICSRHFSKKDILCNNTVKRTAVPRLYELSQDSEETDEQSADEKSKSDHLSAFFRKAYHRKCAELNREKKVNKQLRRIVDSKNKEIKRLKAKLILGKEARMHLFVDDEAIS
ncbi:hypothetical protein KM043_014091 [Ampulex compressa]|nr:hypothetical protein KM043_014091 [Ampulex compressa]